MGGVLNKLTDMQLRRRNGIKRDKEETLSDGGGLYARCQKGGFITWYFQYKRRGSKVAVKVCFGRYPDVGLKVARELRQECREWRARGKDPKTEYERRRDASAEQASGFSAQPPVMTRSGTVYAPNLVHMHDGWHLSYCGRSAAYGCETTALVIDNWVFFVLKGDHCQAWARASTLWEALQYFVAHEEQIHSASEHRMALGLEEDCFSLMPTLQTALTPAQFAILREFFTTK